MRKGINLQIQEVRLTLNSINPKKSTSKYTVIKLLKTKDKEKLLKAARNLMHYLQENNDFNDNQFPMRNSEDRNN